MALKVLIVDDDKNIAELLRLYTEREGYATDVAYDGEEALEKFKSGSPNIVLLDIMLPKLDGLEVCKEIRRTSDVPIIMLTAKGETFDKVLGLELGADDYVTKPFDAKEVVARMKAVIRRSTETERKREEIRRDEPVKYDNLEIDMSNYELKIKGKAVETPPKELELIYFLAKNPNKVFTRSQLLSEVWDFDYPGGSRTVDVHIKRLREKLDGVSEKWSLKTVWGVGYKFETE